MADVCHVAHRSWGAAAAYCLAVLALPALLIARSLRAEPYDDGEAMLGYFGSVLALPATVLSGWIVHWFLRLRVCVGDGHLEIQEGIVRPSRRKIRMERIAALTVRASWTSRLRGGADVILHLHSGRDVHLLGIVHSQRLLTRVLLMLSGTSE